MLGILVRNIVLTIVEVNVREIHQKKTARITTVIVRDVFVEMTLHSTLKKENSSTSKKKVVVGVDVNQNVKNVISGHNYYIRI